jgi:hypothetical protein
MMRRSDILRMALALCMGAALTWGGLGFGCNPAFVQSLGGAAYVPTAPGTNPYILVRVLNAVSGATMPVPPGSTTLGAPVGIGFALDWRYAGGQPGGLGLPGAGLAQNEDIGELVDCNMTVITMGDVNDLTAPGAWLRYHGTLDFVQQPIVPFGKLLQNGVDFRCGDVITFVTYNDSSATRGYAIDYQVQSGETVTGPFTGPDTFTMFTNQSDLWTAWATSVGILP